MVRLHTLLAISLLSCVAFGCVSSEKYNAARMDSDQYATRLAVVEGEKNEALASARAYKQQLDNVLLNGNSKDALIVNQSNQISDLQNQLAEANKHYENASRQVGTTILLPPELNEALKQFASQNPDLVEFDPNRGIVKFKSDVTFAPGSSNLTASAASAIDRFATILNSPAAAGYELMVVGHTDNVRVAHEATLRAGHKDNWYLSAHRAISVSSELQKQGVSAGRLEVAGFADQRPIAPNTTDAGKAQNRRVEVLIMPPTSHSSMAVAPSAPPALVARQVSSRQPARPTAEINKDGNKDSPAPERKTVYNK